MMPWCFFTNFCWLEIKLCMTCAWISHTFFFIYTWSLLLPFPTRMGRIIYYLNTRCRRVGWDDRMGPWSSLLWRLGILVYKIFCCLSLYHSGPEGDIRCSAVSYPEQCLSRIPNTPKGGWKNISQGPCVYLWLVLMKRTKGSAQYQK